MGKRLFPRGGRRGSMPGDDDAGGRVLAVTHHDAHRVRGRSVRYRSTRTVGAPAYENLGSGSDTYNVSLMTFIRMGNPVILKHGFVRPNYCPYLASHAHRLYRLLQTVRSSLANGQFGSRTVLTRSNSFWTFRWKPALVVKPCGCFSATVPRGHSSEHLGALTSANGSPSSASIVSSTSTLHSPMCTSVSPG